MFLPEIKHYVEWLSHVDYRHIDNDFTYDKHSYELLAQLFDLAAIIAPNKNGVRSIWLQAQRGVIGNWADYQELLDQGEVENWEEFVAIWEDYFPDEEEWIPVDFIIEKDYRAVFMRHRLILECDDRKPHASYPSDVSAFVEWLLNATRAVVEDIRAGLYNQKVSEELPPQHRVGIIRRSDMYKVFPKWKTVDFEGVSVCELYEFIGAISAKGGRTPVLTKMCANDFYRFCSLGYVANKYSVGDMTPAEQYRRFADGRDEGLSEIDPTSYKAFAQWLDNRWGGGHPFEVCAGGNSTHIDLFVTNKNGKYQLVLKGSSENRFIETIKFYLALRHAGAPVVLRDAKQLLARVMGTEEIGIVPENVFPRYCNNYFPGKEIISFMNLPRDNRAEFAALCKWQPIEPVRLLDDLQQLKQQDPS